MARTNAISLISSGALKAELQELYGYVIESVQKNTLSAAMKSQQYSGNPAAGSVEFRRFVNSVSKEYGTARAAAKGDAVKAPPVTVNIDCHREIVEEVAQFDLDTFGVGNLMSRRVDNHALTMGNELDVVFFEKAVAEGGVFAPSGSGLELEELLEEMIQKLENVKNEYVNGVPRNMMNLVCSTKFFGKVRNLMDTKPGVAVDTAAEDFGLYHGVRVYSHINLPQDVNAVLMIDGAIAQPVVTYPYTEPEKIPLSNDYGVGLFYDYATKVLTPDLVLCHMA